MPWLGLVTVVQLGPQTGAACLPGGLAQAVPLVALVPLALPGLGAGAAALTVATLCVRVMSKLKMPTTMPTPIDSKAILILCAASIVFLLWSHAIRRPPIARMSTIGYDFMDTPWHVGRVAHCYGQLTAVPGNPKLPLSRVKSEVLVTPSLFRSPTLLA